MAPRVFLALRLPREVAAAAAAEVRAALGGDEAERGFRLPRADGLHVTLFFVGETPRERLAELAELARAELAGRPAPELRLTLAGVFPARGRARVLWIGAAGVGEADRAGLAELRAACLRAARRFGCDTTREEAAPFVPHVTVARPRGRSQVPPAFHELAPGGVWRPRAVELLTSVRSCGPARYDTLEELPLGP